MLATISRRRFWNELLGTGGSSSSSAQTAGGQRGCRADDDHLRLRPSRVTPTRARSGVKLSTQYRAEELAGKNVSEMTHFGTQNFNSVNQSGVKLAASDVPHDVL